MLPGGVGSPGILSEKPSQCRSILVFILYEESRLFSYGILCGIHEMDQRQTAVIAKTGKALCLLPVKKHIRKAGKYFARCAGLSRFECDDRILNLVFVGSECDFLLTLRSGFLARQGSKLP